MNTFKMKTNRITLNKSDIFTGKIHQKFKPILGYSSRTYSTSNSAGPNKPALTWSEWATPYFTADYYYLGYGVAAAAAITTAYVSYCYIAPAVYTYMYNNSTVENGNKAGATDAVPRADYEALANKLSQTTTELKLTTQILKDKEKILKEFIKSLQTPEAEMPLDDMQEETAALIINSCNAVADLTNQKNISNIELNEQLNYIAQSIKLEETLVTNNMLSPNFNDTVNDAIIMACSMAMQVGSIDMDPETLNTILKTILQITAARYNNSRMESFEIYTSIKLSATS